MNLQVVRYGLAAAIGIVVLALAGVVVVVILRGGVTANAPSVVGLLTFIGTLIGVIANLLGTREVAVVVGSMQQQVQDVQDKVNGHLQAHMASSRAQGAAEALQGRQELPPAS